MILLHLNQIRGILNKWMENLPMLTTLEEHYRITDRDDPSRERGLLTLYTTMTQGNPLYSHRVNIIALDDETLCGDYSLEFVKRFNSPDLYRRARPAPRPSFNQLAAVNDPRPTGERDR